MDWQTIEKRDVGGPGRGPARKRTFVAVGLVTVLLAVSLAAAGFAWAKKEITVLDGGNEQTVSTCKRTVGDLLPALGIEIGPHDLLEPAPGTRLENGLRIAITRAVPVTVRADGAERRQMTTVKTVAELLDQCGVTLGALDLIQPTTATAVKPGLEVTIVRVAKETEVREEEIPFSVTRQPAYNLAKGQMKQKSEGVPGLKKETWEVTYHDGEVASQDLLESEVIRKPQNKVVLVGTVETASRGGHDIHFSRSFTARATAYTYTGRNTATGKPPGPGTVAVDPSVIPLGSKLYIDGYGHGTAMDVGRSIKGNRVDVFFTTRAQALGWGSRTVNVYVLP